MLIHVLMCASMERLEYYFEGVIKTKKHLRNILSVMLSNSGEFFAFSVTILATCPVYHTAILHHQF